MKDFLYEVNSVLWVIANLSVIYIAVLLVVFVAGYYFLFDPKATTAGRFIFRFTCSLLGVIALIIISVYINPTNGNSWWVYPGDVYAWRPAFRVVVYGYIAYTITGLAVILYLRRFYPTRLRTAGSVDSIVKIRHPKPYKDLDVEVLDQGEKV